MALFVDLDLAVVDFMLYVGLGAAAVLLVVVALVGAFTRRKDPPC